MTTKTIDYDQLRSFARLVKRRPDRSYRYAVLRQTTLGRAEVRSWHRTPSAAREGLSRAVLNRGPGLAAADFCAFEVMDAVRTEAA